MLKSYRDILDKRERRDPVTNIPIRPLPTEHWASRSGFTVLHRGVYQGENA